VRCIRDNRIKKRLGRDITFGQTGAKGTHSR